MDDYYSIGVEMTNITEIKIARYALIAILLMSMANFYTSINALAQTTNYGNHPSILSGYNK